jgi:hypothetical protein
MLPQRDGVLVHVDEDEAIPGFAADLLQIGIALQGFGAILGVVGPLVQGVAQLSAANAQAAALEDQRRAELDLNAAEDRRRRQQFGTQIRQQAAELAARGVSLDSPAAILLGQTAAAEMSFDSQATRSQGAARAAELSAEARMVRARGVTDLLGGTFKAAGSSLNAAPELWPGLSERRVGTGRGLLA